MATTAFVKRMVVSTHSRLKAAGNVVKTADMEQYGFNTQPPEGGWGD